MAPTFDELVDRFKDVVTVLEIDLFEKTGLYGAYRLNKLGLPYIFIEQNQREIDKKVILVEEFKHMMTSYGVIVNQKSRENIKQENLARGLTYKKLISLEDLFNCYEQGLNSEYEIAEELDVPQEFLHNAIQYFKDTYGTQVKMKNGYTAVIAETISFYKLNTNAVTN